MGIFENDGGPHYGQGAGMLLGLAVGDALGAYLEFEEAREPEKYLREYQAPVVRTICLLVVGPMTPAAWPWRWRTRS